jgi:hypothetical protein
MIAKSLIAAAAVAATMTLALPAQEAKAGVDVNIGIGFGGYVPGHYAGGYGYGYGPVHGYGYGYGYPTRPPHHISCSTGRRIVDNAGFNRVKPVDCTLPGYRYTAHKKGHRYMVRVNGRGKITGVSRIY